MRVIVRYLQNFGNYQTKGIDLEENDNINDLKFKIQLRFQIPIQKQLLKINRNGLQTRLNDSFNLEFYDIHERCIIFVEQIESEQEKQKNQRKNGYNNLLRKLNPELKIINEEDENKIGKSLLNTNANLKLSTDCCSNNEVENFNYNDENMINYYEDFSPSSQGDFHSTFTNYQQEKIIKQKTESLLNLTKEGKIRQIEELIKENGDIINKIGNSGWNSLHFSIFCNQTEIVNLFLNQKEINVNQQTIDNWTPLQLAIHRNNIDIAYLLLKQETIEINKTTSRGSALHQAVKTENIELIQQLLQQGIDPLLKDEANNTAVDLAISDKVISIINVKIEAIQIMANPVYYDQIKFAQQMQPPLVKGIIYKVGNSTLIKHNKRYLVLNPQDHNIYRYQTQDDYPLNTLEIISIKDIQDVSRVYNKFYMRDRFNYFEIISTKKMIFCTKFEWTANQWVEFIIRTIDFAQYLEKHVQDSKVQQLIFQQKQTVIELHDNSNDQTLQSIFHNQNKVVQQQIKSINNLVETKPVAEKLPNNKVNFSSFKLLKELGSGSFGKVFLVQHKESKKLYAMKALKKQQLILDNQLKYAVGEANIMKKLNCPYILKLYYTFQTPRYLYLIIEYCSGNDLGYHLARNYSFLEEQARFYIAEIILAIEYLHKNDVVYRDLKPENVLLDGEMHVILGDFGLSKQGIKDDQTATSFCGSHAYLAPELLNKKGSGKPADIYGIGAVLFEMITGIPPYYHDDVPTMYEMIKKGKLDFPSHISQDAQNLIRKLLNKDPKNRISIKQIKTDNFFKDIDWEKLARREIVPPQIVMDDDHDCDHNDYVTHPQQVRFYDKDYVEENKTVNRVINFSFSIYDQ